MDINVILANMAEIEKKKLLEAAGNEMNKRPKDQDNGDHSTPTSITDPAGGANGLGKDAHRPADKMTGADGKPAPQEIIDMQPSNKIPDPSAVNPKTKGPGDTVSPDEVPLRVGLAESFKKKLTEGVAGFKIEISEKAKPVLAGLELSESAIAEALSLFEGTINEAALAHITAINEQAATVIGTVLEAHMLALEEKTDKYMTTAIAEWTEKNRLAIETGFRTQIAESFMDKLKGLLESHFVEVPEGKADMYQKALTRGQEVLESFNAEKEKTVALTEENTALKKKLAIENACSGLVVTQAEKLRGLAESVAFDEKFEAALTSLKEEVTKPAAKKTPAEAAQDASSALVESQDNKNVGGDKTVEALAKTLHRFK